MNLSLQVIEPNEFHLFSTAINTENHSLTLHECILLGRKTGQQPRTALDHKPSSDMLQTADIAVNHQSVSRRHASLKLYNSKRMGIPSYYRKVLDTLDGQLLHLIRRYAEPHHTLVVVDQNSQYGLYQKMEVIRVQGRAGKLSVSEMLYNPVISSQGITMARDPAIANLSNSLRTHQSRIDPSQFRQLISGIRGRSINYKGKQPTLQLSNEIGLRLSSTYDFDDWQQLNTYLSSLKGKQPADTLQNDKDGIDSRLTVIPDHYDSPLSSSHQSQQFRTLTLEVVQDHSHDSILSRHVLVSPSRRQFSVFSLGRHPRCDIQVNRCHLSRVQIIIVHIDGRWFIIDNQSTNGSWVRISKALYPITQQNQEIQEGGIKLTQQEICLQLGEVRVNINNIQFFDPTCQINPNDLPLQLLDSSGQSDQLGQSEESQGGCSSILQYI